MATGKIKKTVRNQFGFIQPDAGGEEVYFRINWVKDAPAEGVAPGMAVEYESKRTPRGLQTKWVRISSEKSTHNKPSDGYRFLNPYNFVRPLPEPKNGSPLLRRTQPPSHDRYVGYSGTIKCELTAVTPIFTASAENVKASENGHTTFEFFRVNGKTAIPASTVRGTVRSVFESATNSCYSSFQGHRRLSHHVDSRKAPQMVPARVEKNGNSWVLRLLTGFTPLQIGRTPNGYQYAAWLHQFWPMRPSGTLRQNPPSNDKIRSFQNRRKKGTEISLNHLKHGDGCYALLEPVQHPFPKVQFWDVVSVDKDKDVLEQQKSKNQKVEYGWLCLNNQNIETKHSERFFFRADNNQTGPKTIPLSKKTLEEYEDLIIDYQERHKDALKKRVQKEQPITKPISKADAAYSRFIYRKEERRVKGGELVYAFLEESGDKVEAIFIAPVSVPRVAYEKRLKDVLEYSHLEKCVELTKLCPACRTFGWVWGTGDPRETTPQNRITAYAGRVLFTHAKLTYDAGSFNTTLSILSSPKPTTFRFYLRAANGKNKEGRDDDWVNYDASGQVIRGRKFYYHHGKQLNETEYQRASENNKTKPIKDDQNRTVLGVQDKDSRFQFDVHFENLSEIELGALLWSLEMEGWHHKIGMAKPLGFGSVKVQVVGLNFVDVTNYKNLFSTHSDENLTPIAHTSFVEFYKKEMSISYALDFDQLANIRDMKAILDQAPELPIHYPRTTKKPKPEGKNFEWFMGNSRSGRNAGPRLTLHIADNPQQGLPLLDKQGREQSK